MSKRLRDIQFQDELYSCGYIQRQLNDIFLYEFDSPQEAASYLGCSVSSIYRYMANHSWPVAQARLLLLKHRGFVPSSKPWQGFQIRGERLITPTGREFTARDLTIPKIVESNDNWRLIMKNQKRLKRS
ncbi:DUF3653 domain-containing protein [Photobacterium salinisoli]|uniref:DUF3653 domain-containing protein n=1 Tax=Photobacterium salinisoli TaxID=1616783 RepID=UPI000EA373D4|nr:DUF3653 domain-containing protein [Photobacterium salinisoli]